ncbi:RidA family protein [Archangium violaceum]|uniref:RidA family protein n=1 Tax=Archangium violaceum TaxID=83451 RepID=UPI00193AEE04|nr:RidA family protein [Archangium violaceum]QRK08425.1 RidA family protein [Archangium violaceum]
MLEFIHPPGPSIPGISPAVVIRAGQPVFLSGHVPTREDGTLETGGLEAQLDAAFRALHHTLRAAGLGSESLVRITLYVRDYQPAELPVIRAVRDRYVSMERPPASALIGVSSLFAEGVRVEVDAVAVRPSPGGSAE